MAKKNPYIFTIGFNSSLPNHVRAAEILNGSSEKAQLIVDAILSYLGEKEDGEISSIRLATIQPLVQSLIQKEIQKALKDCQKAGDADVSEVKERMIDLTQEQELSMDKQFTKNIADAMSAFRKMK